MKPEQVLFGLRNIIDTMPDLHGDITEELMTWLGRASSLVEAAGNGLDAAAFTMAMDDVIGENRTFQHGKAVDKVKSIIFRAYGRVEAKSSYSLQGSYIPAGNVFDAFAAVSKVFSTATTQLLIVDPYSDEKLLRDFAPLAGENVFLQILADNFYVKSSFQPAIDRWRKQHEPRSLECRLTPDRQLHDRLIIVDDSDVWIVTQSFKDLAERASASVTRFEPEPAQLKLASYRAIWAHATSI